METYLRWKLFASGHNLANIGVLQFYVAHSAKATRKNHLKVLLLFPWNSEAVV